MFYKSKIANKLNLFHLHVLKISKNPAAKKEKLEDSKINSQVFYFTLDLALD